MLGGATFKFAGASNYYMLTRAVEKATRSQVSLAQSHLMSAPHADLLHALDSFSLCSPACCLVRVSYLCTALQVAEVFETAEKMGLKVMRVWAFNDGDAWNALQPRMGQVDERVLK